MQSRAAWNGPLATLGLLLTASLVFAQVDTGFTRIWEVRDRRPTGTWLQALAGMALKRLRSLAMIAGMLLLVIVTFAAGLAVRAANRVTARWWPEVEFLSGLGSNAIGFGMNVVVFTLLYRTLSKEAVRWRLCAGTGLLIAVFWEAGSLLMTALSFGSNYSVYGIIGSFLVILLWVYYNAMVLFAGALVVRVRTRPLGN
jgi:membrane protein